MERLYSPYRSFRQSWFIHCPAKLPDIVDYFFSLYTQTFPTENATWVLARKTGSNESSGLTELPSSHPLEILFKNQKHIPLPKMSKWIVCASTHTTIFKSHHYPSLVDYFPEAAPYCIVYAHPLCLDDHYTLWICFIRHTSHPLFPKTYLRISKIFGLLKNSLRQKISEELLSTNRKLTHHDFDFATLLHQIKAPIHSAELFFSDKDSLEEQALAKYFSEAKNFLGQLLQYLRAKHLPVQNISLQSFLLDVQYGFSTELQKSNILFNIESSLDLTISVHKVALYQVFENLIHNILALKGHIHLVTLKCTVTKSNKASTCLCMELSDDGPGLPTELTQGFGQAFRASPNSSGMGLYICKRLVELQNGTLCYTSPNNHQNGFFTIALPIVNQIKLFT